MRGNDAKKQNLQQTLKNMTESKEPSKLGYFITLALYLATSAIVKLTAGSDQIVFLNGNPLAIYAFAGVFSALSNICIIFLVIYYKKLGFYTSITAMAIQIPTILMGIFMNHNLSSLPGLFTNIFTMIAIISLYLNNNKVNDYQTKLMNNAVTDSLTKLPNRFACRQVVKGLITRNVRFALVLADIKNFKSINYSMGHDSGNEVLSMIAERWKNAADSEKSGTKDFVARIDGDKFAIVVQNYNTNEDILKTIAYYSSVLEKKLTLDNCDFFLSANFGYAEFPFDADHHDTLLTYADTAMYKAKSSDNSDNIKHFSPEMLSLEHTRELEQKLRAAIDNDTLYFNLQPQYDLSHRLRGFEALARMKDADGNNVSPAEFIPAAEKAGMIDKVDLHVFRRSAEFLGRLIQKTGSDITLSINVSVRHLMKNNFLEEIKEILDSCAVPPQQLEIEITESVMIDSAEKALQCINDIRELGIKIAIDDFGTGYSSLSYLNKFPADILKIDKSFIDKMNSSDSSKQYVAAIISIGHIMNFRVISEGVEKDDQLETLRSIGCDYIQGYIWGRPLPPEEAEALVMSTVKEQ